MAKSPAPSLTTAQLNAIIDNRPPEMARLTKAVLAKMRERLPGAVETGVRQEKLAGDRLLLRAARAAK